MKKLSYLLAAAAISGLAILATPSSASPLASGLAAGNATVPHIDEDLVQNVHGWHCRWRRGHRHRRACYDDDYGYDDYDDYYGGYGGSYGGYGGYGFGFPFFAFNFDDDDDYGWRGYGGHRWRHGGHRKWRHGGHRRWKRHGGHRKWKRKHW